MSIFRPRFLYLLAALALIAAVGAVARTPVHADSDDPPTGWVEIVYDGGLSGNATRALPDVAKAVAAGGQWAIVTVAAWDNAAQSWQLWHPNAPDRINRLSQIEPGGIYWFRLRAVGGDALAFHTFTVPVLPTPLVETSGTGLMAPQGFGYYPANVDLIFAPGRYNCAATVADNAGESFFVHVPDLDPPSDEPWRSYSLWTLVPVQRSVTAGGWEVWPLIVGDGPDAHVAAGIIRFQVITAANAPWTIRCTTTDAPPPPAPPTVSVSGTGDKFVQDAEFSLSTGRYTCTVTVRNNLAWDGSALAPAAFSAFTRVSDDGESWTVDHYFTTGAPIEEGVFTGPLIVGKGKIAIVQVEAAVSGEWTVGCAPEAEAAAG